MPERGKFIVIDGMDHAGKDTQMDLLKEKLEGQNMLFTREPGGTSIAELIRERLMEKEVRPIGTPLEDFLLFYGARVLHINDTVEPARAAGTHVISNRYDSSTWAYQICAGEKRELGPLFAQIRGALPSMYRPDAYLFLMLPPEVAYERGQKATDKEKTRFDVKPLQYYQRVETGFISCKTMGEDTQSSVHFINAYQTREEVQRDLWNRVQEVLMDFKH